MKIECHGMLAAKAQIGPRCQRIGKIGAGLIFVPRRPNIELRFSHLELIAAHDPYPMFKEPVYALTLKPSRA